MSMTRSKLSWLHGLFGDDILITRQHFGFSEKHVISLPSLDMPCDQHENIIPRVEFNIV